MEVVRKVEDCGTTSGEPTKTVQIAECGQIPDETKAEEDESDQEGEEEEEEGDDEGERRGKKRPRVRFAKSDDGADGDDGDGAAAAVKGDANGDSVSEKGRSAEGDGKGL